MSKKRRYKQKDDILLKLFILLILLDTVDNNNDKKEYSYEDPRMDINNEYISEKDDFIIDTIDVTDAMNEIDTIDVTDAMNEIDTIDVTGTMNEIDTIDVTDTMNEIDMVDVTDSMNEIDMVDVTDAMNEIDTVDVTDAMNEIDTIDMTGTMNEIDTVDVTGTMNEIDTIDVTDAMNEIDMVDVTDSMNEIDMVDVTDAMNEIDTVDVTDAMNEIDTIDMTGTMNEIDTVDVTDTMNTIDVVDITGTMNTINIVDDIDVKIPDKINNILNVNEEIDKKESTDFYSKSVVLNATAFQHNNEEDIGYRDSLKSAVSEISLVISQFELEVFIEALINFPEPVFQVNILDKKVILKECKLVKGTDKLFIKGSILEHIEYATANSIKNHEISGDLKEIMFNIPFQCSTKVSFLTHPKLHKNEIFCNLDSMEILETNNREEINHIKNTLMKEYTFERMGKKIILTLDLSLLQNQDTFIYNSNCSKLEDTYENN